MIVVEERDRAVPPDHAIECGKRLGAIHPVEGAAHRHQAAGADASASRRNFPAGNRAHAGGARLLFRGSEHVRLGIDTRYRAPACANGIASRPGRNRGPLPFLPASGPRVCRPGDESRRDSPAGNGYKRERRPETARFVVSGVVSGVVSVSGHRALLWAVHPILPAPLGAQTDGDHRTRRRRQEYPCLRDHCFWSRRAITSAPMRIAPRRSPR